jgi:hypothetical protein
MDVGGEATSKSGEVLFRHGIVALLVSVHLESPHFCAQLRVPWFVVTLVAWGRSIAIDGSAPQKCKSTCLSLEFLLRERLATSLGRQTTAVMAISRCVNIDAIRCGAVPSWATPSEWATRVTRTFFFLLARRR